MPRSMETFPHRLNKARNQLSDKHLNLKTSAIFWKVAGVFDANQVDPKLVIAKTFTNDFVKRAKERLKLT